MFLLTFGMNTMIGAYIGIVLPLRGIEMDYEDYLGKRVTYVATACGVLSFLRYPVFHVSLIIAVWKCWGFWTIGILFVVFLGYINSAHFFPNNQFGSFLSGLTFLLICFSSSLIDHEGYLHYEHEED